MLYKCSLLTFWQAAIGNGAGAVERVVQGACDEAQVRQAVVKAGFTPAQADDALRAVGPSLQVSSPAPIPVTKPDTTPVLIPLSLTLLQSCLSFLCLSLPG